MFSDDTLELALIEANPLGSHWMQFNALFSTPTEYNNHMQTRIVTTLATLNTLSTVSPSLPQSLPLSVSLSLSLSLSPAFALYA